jgi:hypothetical protein
MGGRVLETDSATTNNKNGARRLTTDEAENA